MLKINLVKLLKHHGISTYRFAKAIQATNIRSENWAYRLVRGEISLTMDTLDLVIAVISQITNTQIKVTDILSYQHNKNNNLEITSSSKYPKSPPFTIAPEGKVSRDKLKFIANATEDAINYTFSIFHYESKSILIFQNTVNNIFIPPKNILCSNVEYGWKVKSFSLLGWSSFSTTKRFIITSDNRALAPSFNQTPIAPQAISPLGVVSNLRPTLLVSPVENATGYSFYLRDIITDRVYDFEYATKSPEFKIPENILKNNAKYKWNSRSFNCTGFSARYSKSLIFEVNLRP